MSEVYIITSGMYSDYRIRAVFSNEKDAQRFCAAHNEDNGSSYSRVDYEPWGIDLPEDMRIAHTGEVNYIIHLDEKQEAWGHITDDPETEDRISDTGHFTTWVTAKGKEHAIKIAQERLMQHKARLAGIA